MLGALHNAQLSIEQLWHLRDYARNAVPSAVHTTAVGFCHLLCAEGQLVSALLRQVTQPADASQRPVLLTASLALAVGVGMQSKSSVGSSPKLRVQLFCKHAHAQVWGFF